MFGDYSWSMEKLGMYVTARLPCLLACFRMLRIHAGCQMQPSIEHLDPLSRIGCKATMRTQRVAYAAVLPDDVTALVACPQ